MNARNIVVAAAVVVVLALLVFASSAYTVKETEWVVLTEFGKPVEGSEKTGPGLHFKTPFIQKVNRIEKRILPWDGDPNRIPTRDKKYIFVDTFARWSVVRPLAFFTSLEGRIQNGHKKLDDIIDSVVRDVVGQYNLIEVVRSSNRELAYESEELAAEMRARAEKIEVGRTKIVAEIRKKATSLLKQDFGIAILDVRIKRVNYVESVRKSVYQRMVSERERIATRYRSEAQEQRDIILGETNRQLALIRGEGEEESAAVRGQADAEAIRIYGDAIAKTSDFYRFLRTLEA
ncbi:MAG: protease modulator HflC, partial [Candidatus Eisenbacteria bacterium]|nr:protease modulator HflC [Candidatus Eisenbacteria bacterium]